MTSKIDSFGRILIPKALRERFGLVRGAEVELEEGEGALLIRPRTPTGGLTVRDGLLVYEGEWIDDGSDTLHEVREERIRQTWNP